MTNHRRVWLTNYMNNTNTNTNTNTATGITPGYNSRLAIWFQTDKNGRKIAYSWAGNGSFMVSRIKLTDAEMFIANGTADQFPGHPFR